MYTVLGVHDAPMWFFDAGFEVDQFADVGGCYGTAILQNVTHLSVGLFLGLRVFG